MSFAARFGSPTREELSHLARKYDTLADLRDRREKGGGVAPRGELSALAREFPGALRELDTLPRAEIERRRASLRAALVVRPPGDSKGDPADPPGSSPAVLPAPWMAWMIAYHATMRAALFIKARLARSGDLQDDRGEGAALQNERVRQIAASAALDTGLPIDEPFVLAVARPPARRVNAAVFERLGRELGVPAEEMWQTLFPTHRARRF